MVQKIHGMSVERPFLSDVSPPPGNNASLQSMKKPSAPVRKRPASDAGPQGPLRQPTWQHVSVGDLDAVMEGQNFPGVPTEGPSSPGSEHEMPPMPKTTSSWKSGGFEAEARSSRGSMGQRSASAGGPFRGMDSLLVKTYARHRPPGSRSRPRSLAEQAQNAVPVPDRYAIEVERRAQSVSKYWRKRVLAARATATADACWGSAMEFMAAPEFMAASIDNDDMVDDAMLVLRNKVHSRANQRGLPMAVTHQARRALPRAVR